ncbi:2-C-methyl-D-erythritol 4-phosphate cytidylyltransferase [Oceanospirillum multiglobuliferum]|uniref:2-C-methyl-D-erythritol 4-phosphate cytidylyltransferase n=1 Tax=Oceanospirillum multiglobuliferum TaxID=64969 RepID=A0A1T4RUG5_9GAMM|nr:2-C-methyl-D-erythritol 4-phosphate cytidylyltransferase [Oceanospirillum multiglobuliferum]OPX54628.1 2-C-methyl-D-erythritol 4-phosphate cytidylyltransferase [Oceanospirillum multiglobuliferum]SKA19537.1 2-C-methyl-D-erythritol 4-phosphate cytidylyltransferase [Oceanospirillum multiglobuliferum]
MSNKLWWLVPAAGVGSRMQADRPKQYLPLMGKTILEQTLQRLSQACPEAGRVICLNPDDPYWPEVEHYGFQPVVGGQERCDSVLNGLKAIADQAQPDDWILVHDVARPCVRSSDIHNLIQQLKSDAVGGILALPVADTMKRATPIKNGLAEIDHTVDRQQLWHALTPQMFRYHKLRDSLERALAAQATITDEASALEWAGFTPKLVAGQRDNIKVTQPDDLYFAALFLSHQHSTDPHNGND